MLFIDLVLQFGLCGLNIPVIFETKLQPIIHLKFEQTTAGNKSHGRTRTVLLIKRMRRNINKFVKDP